MIPRFASLNGLHRNCWTRWPPISPEGQPRASSLRSGASYPTTFAHNCFSTTTKTTTVSTISSGSWKTFGLIHDAAINDVKRYRMSEELADYLTSRRAASAVSAEWQWEDKAGVWMDPASGHRYCAKCKADGKSSPLKTEEHGYRCNVCGQYTNEPTRPRKQPSLPAPVRGPHGWMAN
jgi:hypothetical protein